MQEWINYMIHEEAKTVLSNDNALISFKCSNGEMYICDLYCKEEFRGKGYGLDVAEKAVCYAKENGCDRMTCNIFINEANQKLFSEKVRLFSKFGFLSSTANNNVLTMVKIL